MATPAKIDGPLYRYFPAEEYAMDFARGRVRISTLNACRATEDPSRGDALEGTRFYSTGAIEGGTDDPDFRTVASRIGFHGRIQEGSIRNNVRIDLIPDAWLLCLTKRPDGVDEKFGRFAVEIVDPDPFFALLSDVLAGEGLIRAALCQEVTYGDLSFTGVDPEPGETGFHKRSEFSPEQEVRMLWVPAGPPVLFVQAFILSCSALAQWCRLVDASPTEQTADEGTDPSGRGRHE